MSRVLYAQLQHVHRVRGAKPAWIMLAESTYYGIKSELTNQLTLYGGYDRVELFGIPVLFADVVPQGMWWLLDGRKRVI